jgi:hypothetical protein
MRVMRAIFGVVVVALAFAFAARAEAGEYVVHACEGTSVAGSGWRPVSSGVGGLAHEPLADECGDAQSRAFGVDLSGATAPGPVSALWQFDAPADTTITALALRRLSIGQSSQRPFIYAIRDAAATDLERRADASWMIGFPDFEQQEFAGLATSFVSFGASCPPETICDGGPIGPRIGARDVRVTLRDDTPPTMEPTPIDSTGSMSVRFSDRGGGVRSVSVAAGGREIRREDFCQEPFARAVPCPVTGTVVFAGLNPGASDMQVWVVDAASNRQTVDVPAGSQRDDEVVPAPRVEVAKASPITGTLRLRGSRVFRARYGSPPSIRGTVSASDGSALAGVVVASSDGTTARTDAKGRFSVKLRKGPSRQVRVSYGEAVQTVKVIVAAPVRFRSNRVSTRNGRSIVFTGSVPGAGNARTRVELQALAHRKWVPFKTVGLRDGRFRASYRFTRTFFTQRYSFRAVIHEDGGFPYAAGKSAVVRVLVRA